MAFNSFHYLAFFPAAVAVFFVLPQRLRWAWLLLASLYFYGLWSPLLLLQIVLATTVSWFLGLKIEAAPAKEQKRRILTSGILLLIANLFVFKYTGFANESVRSVFGWFGGRYPIPTIQLLLPLGISFYTFQLIAYLVDVHRGEKAERHLGVFGVFIAFFPKLVSGPIERAKNLLPQLHREQTFDYARVVAGLELMAYGFFKKVVVADRLAPAVTRVYDDPRAYDGIAMVAATWLFAFQVYCDFSGYTDIARGSAQVMGYKLMENFNRPYFATSIADFWKRWHISLTTWLTDYVYTPLTRQRRFKIKFYYLILWSLFITFVVSGLWHGAQWTFVVWGALHGSYIVCSTLTQKWRARVAAALKLDCVPRLHRAYKVAVTFGLVCIAYVFFQAHTLADAVYILTHSFTGWSMSGLKEFVSGQWVEVGIGLLGMAAVLLVDSLVGGGIHELLAKRSVWVRWSIYQACALSIVLFGAFYETNQKFIYFQF